MPLVSCILSFVAFFLYLVACMPVACLPVACLPVACLPASLFASWPVRLPPGLFAAHKLPAGWPVCLWPVCLWLVCLCECRLHECARERKGMLNVRVRSACSNVEYSNVRKIEKACSNVRQRNGCPNIEYSNVERPKRHKDRNGMFESSRKDGCSNVEYSNVRKSKTACSQVRKRNGTDRMF